MLVLPLVAILACFQRSQAQNISPESHHLQQAVDEAWAKQDGNAKALALIRLGREQMETGQSPAAAGSLDEAMRLAEGAHSTELVAGVLTVRGDLEAATGKLTQAIATEQEALRLRRETGDSKGEAETLTSLGKAYTAAGQPKDALEPLQLASKLRESAGEAREVAETLSALGDATNQAGDAKEGLKLLDQALALRRAGHDRRGEGVTLTTIGEVYWGMGDAAHATSFYDQALPIHREVRNPAGEAVTLNDLATAYSTAGKQQEAIKAYQKALELFRAVGDGSDEAAVVSNLGATYEDMGRPEEAVAAYNQALALERAVGNRDNEGITLHEIGAVYQDLTQPREAKKFYEQALILERGLGNKRTEARTLCNLAGVYRDMDQRRMSLRLLHQALVLQQKLGAKGAEALTLQDIGSIHVELKEPERGLVYYRLALPLEKDSNDHLLESLTLWRMATLRKPQQVEAYLEALALAQEGEGLNLQGVIQTSLMQELHRERTDDLAIYFGKRAVNAYQKIRGNLNGFDKETLAGFVQAKSETYRMLAKLLIDQGRIPEAEQVIAMLKSEEYREYSRGAAGSDSAAAVPLNSAETGGEGATAQEMEWLSLRSLGPKRTSDQSSRFAELGKKLDANQRKFTESMQQMMQSGEMKEQDKDQASNMQNLLGEVAGASPNTVGVYTLVLDKEVDLVVITRKLRLLHRVMISREALSEKIATFRLALQDPCSDIERPARELYTLLIAPILPDLRGADAKNIVWELDRALRYIPMAALYDGQRYMVEEYGSGVFAANNLFAMGAPVNVSQWNALGLGTSEPHGVMRALPAVPDELNGIIRDPDASGSKGPIPGKILLNTAFRPDAMQLISNYRIVHIASHFVLRPGSLEQSFLLLGAGDADHPENDRLSMADLNSVNYDFSDVQLLTLSACDTAISGGASRSDGKEVDALGSLASGRGAKAVMATLWAVSDASTERLMVDFYSRWTNASSVLKIQALRGAQEGMLREALPDRSGMSCGAAGTAPKFAHPYYWAPFVVIGNWQ